MDVPSRVRILAGGVAIFVAVLAALALLNLLVLEPGGTDGTGTGTGTADGPGQGIPGQQGTGEQPNPGEEPGSGDPEEGEGEGQSGGKKNPCQVVKPIVRGTAITVTLLAMVLWAFSVWWRQLRETKVMNGWAIFALVMTLFAITMLFIWWIVHKICLLDIVDWEQCKEIAKSLLGMFIAFLVPSIALIAFGIVVRAKHNRPFFNLWTTSGFIFLYMAIMAMVGWLVADDICERYFEPPDEEDLPDFDGGGNDSGQNGNNNGNNNNNEPDPNPGNSNPGGSNSPSNPGSPNTPGGSPSTGGNAAPSLQAPQLSPVVLLVILGIAAFLVIVVMAVRSKGVGGVRAGGMAGVDIEDRDELLRMLKSKKMRSRDRVVAAYRAYLAFCTARGIPKLKHDTPREHARKAIQGLALPHDKTMRFIDAYLVVRLSNQELQQEERRMALQYSREMKDKEPEPEAA